MQSKNVKKTTKKEGKFILKKCVQKISPVQSFVQSKSPSNEVKVFIVHPLFDMLILRLI